MGIRETVEDIAMIPHRFSFSNFKHNVGTFLFNTSRNTFEGLANINMSDLDVAGIKQHNKDYEKQQGFITDKSLNQNPPDALHTAENREKMFHSIVENVGGIHDKVLEFLSNKTHAHEHHFDRAMEMLNANNAYNIRAFTGRNPFDPQHA